MASEEQHGTLPPVQYEIEQTASGKLTWRVVVRADTNEEAAVNLQRGVLDVQRQLEELPYQQTAAQLDVAGKYTQAPPYQGVTAGIVKTIRDEGWREVPTEPSE